MSEKIFELCECVICGKTKEYKTEEEYHADTEWVQDAHCKDYCSEQCYDKR